MLQQRHDTTLLAQHQLSEEAMLALMTAAYAVRVDAADAGGGGLAEVVLDAIVVKRSDL